MILTVIFDFLSSEVYKRITCITYSDDGCVLFGDKTGRAYQWTVEQQAAARNLFTKPLEEQSKEEINSTQPNLMLGHCSLVTDIVRINSIDNFIKQFYVYFFVIICYLL